MLIRAYNACSSQSLEALFDILIKEDAASTAAICGLASLHLTFVRAASLKIFWHLCLQFIPGARGTPCHEILNDGFQRSSSVSSVYVNVLSPIVIHVIHVLSVFCTLLFQIIRRTIQVSGHSIPHPLVCVHNVWLYQERVQALLKVQQPLEFQKAGAWEASELWISAS